MLQERIKILIKKELRQDLRHDFVSGTEYHRRPAACRDPENSLSWLIVSRVAPQAQAHKHVATEKLMHWGLQMSLEEWLRGQLDEKEMHFSMTEGTFQRISSSVSIFLLQKMT